MTPDEYVARKQAKIEQAKQDAIDAEAKHAEARKDIGINWGALGCSSCGATMLPGHDHFCPIDDLEIW